MPNHKFNYLYANLFTIMRLWRCNVVPVNHHRYVIKTRRLNHKYLRINNNSWIESELRCHGLAIKHCLINIWILFVLKDVCYFTTNTQSSKVMKWQLHYWPTLEHRWLKKRQLDSKYGCHSHAAPVYKIKVILDWSDVNKQVNVVMAQFNKFQCQCFWKVWYIIYEYVLLSSSA